VQMPVMDGLLEQACRDGDDIQRPFALARVAASGARTVAIELTARH
jgi:hypothetical protein